jgi:hypothetical protein
MLDRSIPTRKALVHSIPISEVKDMKTDVLRALKGSLSGKKLWTLFAGSILTIFKKEKLHRLWISWCNISTVGIKKNQDSLTIHFFLSSHIHSYLLILLKYKNQVLLIFNFLMSLQFTSLRCSQGTPTKKQTYFYWKF